MHTMATTNLREARRQLRPMRALSGIALTLMLGTTVTPAASATAAARPPVVSTDVNHFHVMQHFDPLPGCGTQYGTTAVATGTERLHVTQTDDMLHVAYGETFRIVETPDDPSVLSYEHQGTDALTFQLVNNGAVQVFHESWHDNKTAFGDLSFHTAFVAVNGEVHVDHTFGRGEVPPGC